MAVSGNARGLPQGWHVLPGYEPTGESRDADDDVTAGMRQEVRNAEAPLTATLPTVWVAAVVTALLLCTPLHPLAYGTALVGLHRAHGIARANGWPVVPGLALLACACGVATGHDVLALWMRMRGG